MTVCRLKRETDHSYSLGDLSGGSARSKQLCGPILYGNHSGNMALEMLGKPTHHRVQPIALLILSDVLLVPQGGSHRGSVEESKQAVTSWSTEPV